MEEISCNTKVAGGRTVWTGGTRCIYGNDPDRQRYTRPPGLSTRLTTGQKDEKTD